MSVLLDPEGRVVATVDPAWAARYSVLCVGWNAGEGVARTVAIGCVLCAEGWRGWRLTGEIPEGAALSWHRSEDDTRVMGSPWRHPFVIQATPADCHRVFARVPPVEDRQRTWLSDDPGCWCPDVASTPPHGSARLILRGEVLDCCRYQPFGSGTAAWPGWLVEFDYRDDQRRPARWPIPASTLPAATKPGDRIAFAIREGMEWSDAYIRPLREIAFPGD